LYGRNGHKGPLLPESISTSEHVPIPAAAPGVLLIGTLDTKGDEIAYVADQLRASGCRPIVLDSGVLGKPSWDEADFPREAVAEAAGTTLADLRELPRGDALARMADGVKTIALALAADGRVEGALCIGGAGVSLAVPAFEALGHGFPKLLVTPLASGQRRFVAFIGTADTAVMHSVADIMGINDVTEPVFVESAGFIAGAVQARRRAMQIDGRAHRYLIAASMNGNTTPALMYAKQQLAACGAELVTFHANGAGGRAMEQLAEQGLFRAVLDYTTTELAGEIVGGLMSAGPARMEVAGRLGLPQVLVPGCLDLITTGRYEETEASWPNRSLYRHNPEFTLVRLTSDEMATLGRYFAEKANRALAPVRICVPLNGFSVPNYPGGPFWDPDADRAFLAALQETLSPQIEVDAVDAHINDVRFVDHVVNVLTEFLTEAGLELTTDVEVMR
jgi:uncharacterized protein (UPF0261 family)